VAELGDDHLSLAAVPADRTAQDFQLQAARGIGGFPENLCGEVEGEGLAPRAVKVSGERAFAHNHSYSLTGRTKPAVVASSAAAPGQAMLLGKVLIQKLGLDESHGSTTGLTDHRLKRDPTLPAQGAVSGHSSHNRQSEPQPVAAGQS